MTSLSIGEPPRRPVRLLRWGLGLLVAAILTGVVGGYGVARLDQPAGPAPAGTGQPEPAVGAPSPPAAVPTRLETTACEFGYDIYATMHEAYLDRGVDFAESRRTAAYQLRALATLYPEPDRTYLIDFSDVLAAGSQISGEDRDAVRVAVDRGSEAYLEFSRLAC